MFPNALIGRGVALSPFPAASDEVSFAARRLGGSVEGRPQVPWPPRSKTTSPPATNIYLSIDTVNRRCNGKLACLWATYGDMDLHEFILSLERSLKVATSCFLSPATSSETILSATCGVHKAEHLQQHQFGDNCWPAQQTCAKRELRQGVRNTSRDLHGDFKAPVALDSRHGRWVHSGERKAAPDNGRCHLVIKRQHRMHRVPYLPASSSPALKFSPKVMASVPYIRLQIQD